MLNKDFFYGKILYNTTKDIEQLRRLLIMYGITMKFIKKNVLISYGIMQTVNTVILYNNNKNKVNTIMQVTEIFDFCKKYDFLHILGYVQRNIIITEDFVRGLNTVMYLILILQYMFICNRCLFFSCKNYLR